MMFTARRKAESTELTELGDVAEIVALLRDPVIEIVPLKSADAAVDALPPRSHVSVTCSPVKGIDATLELSARIASAGHHVTPHIAARMVDSPDHLRRIARRCRVEGIDTLFVIGGDQETPRGPYRDGVEFLDALLQSDHGFTTVGFAAYPDGHALIERGVLREATLVKQALVESASVQPFVSTQMCFDPATIRSWLIAERAAGLRAPVHLGLPGVVDRTKLLTMGARLGIGTSLRFLKKNRATVGKLLSPGGFDPMTIIGPLAPSAVDLGIDAVHLFTFNEVAATAAWLNAVRPV
jgi:methylenetetrahydrofolate reductase (NADPH)